jgi:alkanesulfonate monooxygenase SsuD/methylene tetrahydromethanopterin reductase-like flavin-dependent oxidoreductase (luciferase family)
MSDVARHLTQPHPWVLARRERVTFGLQAFAPLGDPEPGAKVLRAGRLADELGLDAFYIGDHPARTPDPFPHLAALAATTTRVWLGSVVYCTLYRHPALTARLASDLDHLAGGRSMLGLGVGWDAAEFVALGQPFPRASVRQAMQDEALEIILGSWGSEPLTFAGQHYAVERLRIARPLQQPRPPLLIAGGGERGTLPQVARWADACNVGASDVGGATPADGLRRKLDALRGRCAEVGRDVSDILCTWFTPWLILAPTAAEAEDKLRQRRPNGVSPEQRATLVVGTPEQAAEHYRALAAAGAQHFVIQTLDAGDEETIRLLATELAPMVAA